MNQRKKKETEPFSFLLSVPFLFYFPIFFFLLYLSRIRQQEKKVEPCSTSSSRSSSQKPTLSPLFSALPLQNDQPPSLIFLCYLSPPGDAFDVYMVLHGKGNLQVGSIGFCRSGARGLVWKTAWSGVHGQRMAPARMGKASSRRCLMCG